MSKRFEQMTRARLFYLVDYINELIDINISLQELYFFLFI